MPGARMAPPCLLLRARATTAEGKTSVLVTSADSWLAASGPVVENHLYNGEVYDARMDLADTAGRHFSHPAYAPALSLGAVWAPAVPSTAIPPQAVLAPQNMPPIQGLRRLPALRITNPAKGVFTVDFGQNMAGVVQVRLPHELRAGANVSMFHAEVLSHPPYTAAARGRLMRQNLRSALARDIYIASGREDAGAVWEPVFAQHGFRYVEVHGEHSPWFPGTHSS